MLLKLQFPFDIISFLVLLIIFLIWFFYQAGWYELAELYKTDLEFTNNLEQQSKRCRCQISKNSTNSFNGIIIAFLESGIYLNSGAGSLPIFNTIVSSLLIPWKNISNYEITRYGEYKLYLGNPMITILTLRTETVRELEDLSGIRISDYLNSN